MGNLVINGSKNLLAWNEDLSQNPPWVPTRLTVPSINNASPQTGNSSAAILHEDNSPATSHYVRQIVPSGLLIQRYFNYSFYAKALNRICVGLLVDAPPVAVAGFVRVNLSTGNLISVDPAFVRYGISPIGSTGWYRIDGTFQVSDVTGASVRISILSDVGSTNLDGLDQDSLYIWRPQVNEGYYPDDTFRTTEVSVT